MTCIAVPPLPCLLPMPSACVTPPASSTEEWAIQAHIDFGVGNIGPFPLSGAAYAIGDFVERATTPGFNSPCGGPYNGYAVGSLGGTPIGGGSSYYTIFRRGVAVTAAAMGANELIHFRLGHGTSPGYGSYAGVTHTVNLSLWYRPTDASAWVQVGSEIQKVGLGHGAGWASGYPGNVCTGMDWGANSNWATATIPTGQLT
jgi:hypothetical protein